MSVIVSTRMEGSPILEHLHSSTRSSFIQTNGTLVRVKMVFDNSIQVDFVPRAEVAACYVSEGMLMCPPEELYPQITALKEVRDD